MPHTARHQGGEHKTISLAILSDETLPDITLAWSNRELGSSIVVSKKKVSNAAMRR